MLDVPGKLMLRLAIPLHNAVGHVHQKGQQLADEHGHKQAQKDVHHAVPRADLGHEPIPDRGGGDAEAGGGEGEGVSSMAEAS